MNIFLRNKLVRGFALIPVGIGSVIGTVYLTNLNKPLDLLDSLSFSERPDIQEEEIIPQVPVSGGGGGVPGGSGSGSGTGTGAGSGPGTSPGDAQGDANQTKEEKTEEETSTTEETTTEETGTTDFVGAEPATIIKQVVSNISGMDLSKNISLPVLFWLLNNLTQGTLAAKQIQINEKKGKGESTETSSEKGQSSETNGPSESDA